VPRAATAQPRAAAAAANSVVKTGSLLVWLPSVAVVALAGDVRADGSASSFSDADILPSSGSELRLESVMMRLSGFEQNGTGYQSQAGPVLGPGSERLTVFEPQLEVVATQGDRLRHRLWLPLDVITEASPNSIARLRPDTVSGASRHLESGTIDWATTYKQSSVQSFLVHSGIHLENPFRSWNAGAGATRAFADQNTVVTAGVLGVLDWFDKFYIDGTRHGRTQRSTTTGAVGVTQILTPSTVANVNYGLSAQEGELGNTWNSVPLLLGVRGPELLPTERVRHALVGRLAQFLPWNGAFRGYYRFYADDWGIVAHSLEGQLMQRLTPMLYIGGLYRFHTQTGPYFFTTLAPVDATLRTADSDLAPLQSNTIGGKIVGDVPVRGLVHILHFEVEYDRYFRSNDLTMNIATCAIGLRF
jgi:hypothetical protein